MLFAEDEVKSEPLEKNIQQVRMGGHAQCISFSHSSWGSPWRRRGAAVKMCKSLGLSSELVWELDAGNNFEHLYKH